MRWYELDSRIERDVLRLGVRIGRLARRREDLLSTSLSDLKPQGIRSMEDYRFLAHLTRIYPCSTSATEASAVLQLSKAATAVRSERFEKDGLVDRFERDSDRRSIEVRVSDKGIAVAHEATLAVQAVYSSLLAPLEPEQMTALEILLRKIDLSSDSGH